MALQIYICKNVTIRDVVYKFVWFRKEKVPEQGIKSNKSCNSLTLFANLDIENFSNAGTVNHNNSFKMKSTSHALEK